MLRAYGTGCTSVGPCSGKYPVAVVEALRTRGIPMFCLGKTATGRPRHPLYLRSDTPLEPFNACH
jgi:hypothetical protein